MTHRIARHYDGRGDFCINRPMEGIMQTLPRVTRVKDLCKIQKE